ncbi:MAG: copper resistance system multicopper oxidase [Gammaproteobacteria bacterium WSBS_2016_MAG_OTU1]
MKNKLTLAAVVMLTAALATPSYAGIVHAKISDNISTKVLQKLPGESMYRLTVDPVIIDTGEFQREGVGFNGTSPGPVLVFEEGEEVEIHVKNNLEVDSSIHWHGIILPTDMDGVPGLSFDGIAPGETYVYRFTLGQSGTYWFHSHSKFQEPDGAYGAMVIKSKDREPYRYDREYVIQLADAHPHRGEKIMRNLKTLDDYYNRQQPTLGDFFSEIKEKGFGGAVANRAAWGNMRMLSSDIEDLQGFTPLINGKSAEQNWTGEFKPGERVRLRFINSSAMAFFDIRIPGMEMLVINSDGNNVQPVSVDEFRIAVAETYDVIIRPKEERAYSIIAESMGRTALGRATLKPQGSEIISTEEIPELRSPPKLTFADMALAHGTGHDMSGMNHDMGAMDHDMAAMDHESDETMSHDEHSGHDMAEMDHESDETMSHDEHSGHDMAGMNHDSEPNPFYAEGSGLIPSAANGGKFLSYSDLRAQKPLYPERPPTREIELRLTGNMERYSWSINGVKYSDAEPVRLQYGERIRFKFVNETMMTHPMHLHGMWSILDVGAGEWNPVKHVVSIAPSTEVYFETEVDAPGRWAFHCHLSYHAAAGMFREVVVEGGPDDAKATALQTQ